jgi:LDH2 family malate/lactate/ureidoglycolate dehydrogenase
VLVFPAERLQALTQAIFERVGAPPDIAQRVAEALVESNLAGHDSHGVIRIPSYVEAVRRGHVIPDARPTVQKESAVLALVDGGWAFGQVSAAFATDLAVRKAREHGLAAVGIVRCTHIGRLGEYPTMAAAQNVASLIVAGGFGGPGATAAPYGGARPLFGTNPLAIGFPVKDRPPVIIDFATTAVAAGKIQVALAKGEPLPPGAILDRHGRPTTDPRDYYEGGMLLPFGGHKGYGLAVAVELLGRVLTGADLFAEPGRGGPVYERSGVLILAIATGAFQDVETVLAEAARTVARIKAVPPAEGFAEVLVPGEPEFRTRAERLRTGLPVPETTWHAIVQTAQSLGLDVSLFGLPATVGG